jgi:DNA helicase-2/ATP-dependent DNA helicase PcrA
MPITDAQRAAAEDQQRQAAEDNAQHIRLIAGPGTGKSRTIERRVAHVLQQGAIQGNVYVVSFTRASCAELRGRVRQYCASLNPAVDAQHVRVSTLHSLALRILRMGNQLNQYPTDPMMLDEWEQKHIYDAELSAELHCAPGRAAEVRLAHDSQWQTLDPAYINQAQITPAERLTFNAFHGTRTNLYSCVLPGEVIYKCVTALQLGALQQEDLPQVDHLIVDEFQDLNACDQEFVRLLSTQDAILFIAGDDDQSIYSFRHADPTGIINFAQSYPDGVTHTLSDCFRCTPAIVGPATLLIVHNPQRVAKNLTPLYGAAAPPVQGKLQIWSFPDANLEARAIAQSCERLIAAGMAGREDEIIILISSRQIQLPLISQELGNRGIPFEEPVVGGIADNAPVRAAFSLLRLIEERGENPDDYVAYRTLVALCSGVGAQTARQVADACLHNGYNFRALFHAQPKPNWLTGRPLAVVNRVNDLRHLVVGWELTDTLAARSADIAAAITHTVFISAATAQEFQGVWDAVIGTLPPEMTLEELLSFFRAASDRDREAVMTLVNERLGAAGQANQPQGGRVRILTMHGAKGLSGKIVFIPSMEQGILPSSRALQAAGLVIEQRRLFYVSLTRAMAACIISHANLHSGPQAFALRQRAQVRLARSQFLNEMQVISVNRAAGLTASEAEVIVDDVANL